MNINPPPHFVDFFRSPFVYMVLVASVAASCAVLATRPAQKFERYSVENEMHNKIDPSHAIEGEQFEFTVCQFGRSGPDLLEMADALGDVLMTFLFLLPAIAVLIFISAVMTLLPSLDPGQYQAAISIAFIYYTSFYWLSIGYLIYNPPGDWGPFRKDLKIISILDDKKD